MKKSNPIYRFWAYDVWGNAKDGYEVNDRSEVGQLEIPKDISDKELLKLLIEKDFLAKHVKLKDLSIDWQDFNIEIDYKDKPLCGLELKDIPVSKNPKHKYDYYIYNEGEGKLYWSNEQGWVDFNNATAFTEDEKKRYKHLPGKNSMWVKYRQFHGTVVKHKSYPKNMKKKNPFSVGDKITHRVFGVGEVIGKQSPNLYKIDWKAKWLKPETRERFFRGADLHPGVKSNPMVTAEEDLFDLAQAMYWWLSDNHEGQSSDKYESLSILSEIYTPGRMESSARVQKENLWYDEIDDSNYQFYFQSLVEALAPLKIANPASFRDFVSDHTTYLEKLTGKYNTRGLFIDDVDAETFIQALDEKGIPHGKVEEHESGKYNVDFQAPQSNPQSANAKLWFAFLDKYSGIGWQRGEGEYPIRVKFSGNDADLAEAFSLMLAKKKIANKGVKFDKLSGIYFVDTKEPHYIKSNPTSVSKEQFKEALKTAKANYKKRELAGEMQYYDKKHGTYNPASYANNILQEVNDIVGGYGLEAYEPGDNNPSHPTFEYINMGDSYALTLVYNNDAKKFYLCDIGTIIEKTDTERE